MDAFDADDVAAACEGADTVFYLIHGMGGADFEDTDQQAAGNFADAVKRHGVQRESSTSRVRCADVPDEELSDHIRSRRDVERILTDTPACVVVLRAAVLIGSGSTSFEIIRQVSERMPVHTVPTWMDSMVQPIAVVDALAALVGATRRRGHRGTSTSEARIGCATGRFSTPSPRTRGWSGPQVEVPLLPTALVGKLVASLTDVPRPTVEALVESLRHDMVAADDDFRTALLPDGHGLVALEEAFARSLAESSGPPEDVDPMGPLPQDPVWPRGAMKTSARYWRARWTQFAELCPTTSPEGGDVRRGQTGPGTSRRTHRRHIPFVTAVRTHAGPT